VHQNRTPLKFLINMKQYKNDFFCEILSFYKDQLERIRKITLSKNDDNISHQHIVSYSTYSPWVDDAEFKLAYSVVKDFTLVDIYRSYELWNFIKRNSILDGDVLEVGVWRGGSGCLMAKSAQLFSECKVYLADTFEGVVKATERDTQYKGGEHSDTSIEMLYSLIEKLKLDNVEVLKGIFPDQVNFDNLAVKPILKLCHIDVDTYFSARDVFNYVWPLVVKGGAVIFDDYGFWGCEGVTNLCNELKPADSIFIHNINGHAIFVKK
jgi:O-methyltransferase